MRTIRRAASARVLLPATVLALAATGAAQAQQGGFFETLGAIFGGRPQPVERVAPRVELWGEEPGLDVTVRPRRRVARPVEESGPPPNTAIDPVANPDWYLTDPTLRKGDIVVLKDRVIVFQGWSGDASEADYTSLDRSRLSKGERSRIRAMTGIMSEARRSAEGAEPDARRTASLRETP